MQRIAMFKFRLTEAELQAFRDAAKACGLDVSNWMRTRLRVVAEKELTAIGRKAAFLEKDKER